MLTILISTTLFSLIVFLAGSILEKFLKKKEEYNFYEKFIFGFIFLSTIALILNFFTAESIFKYNFLFGNNFYKYFYFQSKNK